MTIKKFDSDIMLPNYKVEVAKMPTIRCTKCGYELKIYVNDWAKGIIGTCKCANCENVTGFEIEGDAVVYVAGKSYGNFSSNVPNVAKSFYTEAESCFFIGAPNASAAMCRASIESALTEAKYTGKDLYEKIVYAKKQDALTDVEVSLAHGSRIITRDAIHRLELISLSDVPSMLSATIHILNQLFPN